MKFLLPFLFTAFVAAAPINLEEMPNPQDAPRGKVFSPSGVYSFWLTPGTEVPYWAIMDGPRGLVAAASPLRFDVYHGALVDDTGLAVLSYVNMNDALTAIDYATEERYPISPDDFIFPGEGEKDSDGPLEHVTPLSLENRIYRASISAFFWTQPPNDPEGEIFAEARSFTAEWDLSQGFRDVTAVVVQDISPIPEPGTWLFGAAGLAAVLLRGRLSKFCRVAGK